MIIRKIENQLMAQVVRYDAFIETAGQVASDVSLNLQGQTAQALAKIDHLLAQVGASKRDLTRVQIWLADIEGFDVMNEVYADWLQDCPKPVRACVGSALVAGGYRIEIQAFAFRSAEGDEPS